jgi:hypothetical protein
MVTDLERLIRQFAADLHKAIRGQVLAEIDDALAEVRHAGALPEAMAPSATRRGPRRRQDVVEALAVQVLGYIKAHPGQRAEQLAVGMKLPRPELTRALAVLVASQRVKRQGRARGTTYTAR